MYPTDKTLVNLKKADQIICLPCDKLKDHPLHFDFYAQSHLEELVCSIRQTGLLEPIVVSPIDGSSYHILSGHYRVRAVRRLRWKNVLCRVVHCDKRLSYVICCTSNILSRSMNAIEEAYIISRLVSAGGFTLIDIGKIWGRSSSWVSRRLGLLTRLNPGVRNDVKRGILSPRTAQELARLPRGNAQDHMLKIIRKNHLNKDAASKLVTWWLDGSKNQNMQDVKDLFDDSKAAGGIKGLGSPEQSVRKDLTKCTLILNELILIVQKENVLSWWPSDIYSSFKKTADYLAGTLDDQYKQEKP